MKIAIKICPICNKEFRSKASAKRKYCSRDCYKVGYSQTMQGRKSWNKGLTAKDHPGIKSTAEKNKGRPNPCKNKSYEEIYGKEKEGEIIKKQKLNRKILVGKEHHSWKGNKAKHKATYHQRARKYRKEYCERCKKIKDEIRNGRLEVHHKDGNIKNNDPENLLTLCNKCHQLIDKRLKMKRDWHGRFIGR